jgi:hypothetical protein
MQWRKAFSAMGTLALDNAPIHCSEEVQELED